MEYFRNSMGPAERCLRDRGIDKRNVHDVVLVIGTEADQTSRRSHFMWDEARSKCPCRWIRKDACTGYWKMKNSWEILNANIASTKAAIENDAGRVESSGADIASLANGMCTGTMAVQVVSDTTAEVAAFKRT